MCVKNQNEGKKDKNIKEKFEIPLKTQKFILQICWAQHDGQWFLKSKKKYGIEETNELNQKIICSMGKIEARHIMSALGVKKGEIKSAFELIKFFNTIMDTIIPKVMKFKFFEESATEVVAIVEKCFIWKEVEKSEKEDEYICACNFRHRGWLEALGIKGEIIPVKRISHGDEICEFRFQISN